MSRFDGQTVLVSGGARGMGASHARGFAAEGASVIIGDVLEEDGQAVAAEIGAQARFVRLDVTDDASWSAAVQAAETTFGPITVLVNNAGVLSFATIEDADIAEWRRVVDINLTGQFLGMRAVTPSMRRAGGGSIVNIATAGSMTGAPLASAYLSSKWGVRGLTKCAALELGRDRIRVNAVLPGYTATPMMSDYMDAYPEEQYAIPRAAAPSDITPLVLYVASAEAGFSTGGEFLADGGWLLGPALPPEQ
jgi:3alpha(or 20beta)-hydroxysteroid dehydrogenase